MYCSNCGNPLDSQTGTCPVCGPQQGLSVSTCPSCGQPVAPGSAACMYCGAPLTGITGGACKSKLTAVLLCFFFGGIGIHDFYLGYTKKGVIKIILTLCTGFGGSLWALIDFILLLVGTINTDARGRRLKN